MQILRTAAALILLTGVASAQTVQPATPLTLDEAFVRASAASHRIAEAVAREEGAQAAIRSREVARQPVIAVSGGYTRTNHVDEFGVPQPNGTLRVIYPDIPDNFFARSTLQWPIYTAGRIDALVRAARAEARASAADVEVARADLRLEVARTYWALVTATESMRVMQEALARADAHLADVRSRFDAGLIPPNEVSAAEAQRSRQELQLIEARNIRSSVLEDLRRLTGSAEDLVAVEPLDGHRPDVAGDTTTAASEQPASTAPGGMTRPEQRALAERVAASEERVAAIRAGRKPTLSFNVTGDYANPNARIFPRADLWRTSWEVGVIASWTLWDGGRIAADSVEASAATRVLQARQAEVASQIATEVRQRQLDLASAHAAIPAAEAGVRSAGDARRVVGERFAVGVATSTDVLDAQLSLLQAELDLTRVRANIRLAEARLERARGRR